MSDEHTSEVRHDGGEVLRDVRCRCGEKLVDAVGDDGEVVIGGDRIPFRRTTDFLACPACRTMYRVSDLGDVLHTGAAAGRRAAGQD